MILDDTPALGTTSQTMDKIRISLVVGLFLFVRTVLSQGYEDQLQQVDRYLLAKYGRNTPGAAVGIVKNGELIYSKGFGMANLDYGIPMTSRSVMNVMSVSKQFTAAAIALLIIDKKMALDESIKKYLPELPDHMDGITIENLIRHTSGIKDYQDLTRLAGITPEDLAYRSDGLKIIKRQQGLNFLPNEGFSYSNSGYLLLSLIVEQVSGQHFPDFVQERIFGPLEMTNSFFSDNPRSIVKNRVVSYGKDHEGSYFRYTLNDNRLGPARSVHNSGRSVQMGHEFLSRQNWGRTFYRTDAEYRYLEQRG